MMFMILESAVFLEVIDKSYWFLHTDKNSRKELAKTKLLMNVVRYTQTLQISEKLTENKTKNGLKQKVYLKLFQINSSNFESKRKVFRWVSEYMQMIDPHIVFRMHPSDLLFLAFCVGVSPSKVLLSLQVFATMKAKRIKTKNITMISVILGKWLIINMTVIGTL